MASSPVRSTSCRTSFALPASLPLRAASTTFPAVASPPRPCALALSQLVRQHERRLVLHIELAGEGEHALALDLVAEGGDGEQVGPQRQLVPGEQGARGDREITMARLAAPSQLACRPPARIANRAAAVRTYRVSVRLGPAQAQEHVLDPAVGHAHDLGGAERARAGRKQEMLRHQDPSRGQTGIIHGSVSPRVQARFHRWQQLHKARNFGCPRPHSPVWQDVHAGRVDALQDGRVHSCA